jgi:signal transduction histidine kinase
MIVARMMSKEWEAARNNDVLKAVINAMAEGLVFVASGGEVALCNPAARQWQRRIRRNNGDVADSFPEALADYIKEAAATDGTRRPAPARIDFRTNGPTERFVEAKSCPVTGPDGRQLGYVIVGQDLTEHRKLEADLLARTEQISEINEMLKMSHIRMAQREKMVALGQMASGIAHEIGNPLTSLSSVVQYLTRKCPPGELKESCSVIDHQVERIAAILKRMLSLAKPATAEYKWTDINEVIENALSLVRFDKRARGITISNKGGAPLPMVWLNPQNLEQCLLNILINALDAMNAKETGCDHRLEVVTAVEGDAVEIHVSDTGVGMSPEVCRRAFESFFTTKEISRGTGLGLYVSYNLLAEMDGSIKLKSEPDVGTTAVIRVPIRPKRVLIGDPASQRSAS